MHNKGANYLTKREQQIMEILYQREPATANELMALLPGDPSNSTVRTLLRILEEKGQVTKRDNEGKFLYSPAKPKKAAAKSALNRVLETFYQGSVRDVVATLLDEERNKLSADDLDQLQKMIDRAREEGR